MAVVDKPFPPGDYDVVVVGSGPGGLQTSYSLRALGVRHAVLSADEEPGGMFRRFPVFERLITWTKPDAPFERGTREYEWYDHNSLLAEEPENRALVAGFMDRSSSMPSRPEMEAGLRAFAEQTGLEIRYGCRWEGTRREEDGLVLVTSDGEYRCRAAVFAVGVTEPWKAPIPGVEEALHYTETGDPSRYRESGCSSSASETRASRSRAACCPGRRRSSWPRRVRSSTRSSGARWFARGISSRSTSTRGAVQARSSSTSRSSASSGRETASGSRRAARPGPGSSRSKLSKCSSRPASGLRCSTCPKLGLATVADGRIPALTPFWESVSVPGVYFAGNASQGSPGLRKQGLASNSTSVNGFRYNAAVLARRLAETRFGLRTERRELERNEVVPYLLRELAHAPELWVQKGYLARVLTFDGAIRDEGIVPLEHFVDEAGPDAVAVAVEMDGKATIYPAVYVRSSGRLVERALPSHPTHAFESPEHRRELESVLGALPS